MKVWAEASDNWDLLSWICQENDLNCTHFWSSNCLQILSWWQQWSRSKNYLFIKKHDYHRKNHLCFRCDYLNHAVKNCKYLFNSNQTSVKEDKIKSQSFKMWSKKHIRVQILHASSFNDSNKTDYSTINNSEFNFNRFSKCSKN